jgi:hypothetical protein
MRQLSCVSVSTQQHLRGKHHQRGNVSGFPTHYTPYHYSNFILHSSSFHTAHHPSHLVTPHHATHYTSHHPSYFITPRSSSFHAAFYTSHHPSYLITPHLPFKRPSTPHITPRTSSALHPASRHRKPSPHIKTPCQEHTMQVLNSDSVHTTDLKTFAQFRI